MFTKTVTVVNPTGLHARPASEFISCAKKFASKITIKKNSVGEKAFNAKSIVALLALGLGQGSEVEISAEGEDEELCVNSLVELISSGFGEI